MATPVEFQSFYLGLLCFNVVFLRGTNASLNMLRRSSNMIYGFSFPMGGVQILLMSLVSKSCWHQRPEPCGMSYYPQSSFSWTSTPTFTRTIKPTLWLTSLRSQKQHDIRNSFLSPEEGHELLKTAQLCSSESCTIPLTKRQGISISKYVKSALPSTTVRCPELWSHKLMNAPEHMVYHICSRQTKVLLLYSMTKSKE